MGLGDDVLTAISSIHAAGLDVEKWPRALSVIADLVGGVGGTLEIIQRPSMRHRALYSHGLAPVDAYLEYYASVSPRLPYAFRQPAGSLLYDAQYIDDAGIDAHPFFMEFLAPHDLRCFLGGVIAGSSHEFAATCIQYSPKAGHPSRDRIKLMRLLLPHFQQATDVMARVGKLSMARHSLKWALDQLVDGVIMLGADGTVRHANAAAGQIARAGDGIAIRRGALAFVSGKATSKFDAALGAIARLRGADISAAASTDFVVERTSGAAPYTVSLRPLVGSTDGRETAAILMFIHDPLVGNDVAVELLRQAFGLTHAEAELAQALRSGSSPDDYARQRKVSANTIYTHLRRIKEKTGCNRMAELIRRLNDIQVAVVAKREC
ncbi:MAG TPA: hypothetical protein VKW08_03115 [Xanthobacteraceae bacterium]|nr:hypothetical protein [Xanthobacteraceae bacterium]